MVATTKNLANGTLPSLHRVARSQTEQGHITLRRTVISMGPTLAAMGTLAPGLGPIYGFRILAIVVLLGSFASPRLKPSGARDLKGIAAFLAFGVGINGLILALSSIDPHAASAEMFSIFCGLAFIVGAVRLAPARNVFLWLLQGWAVAFVVVAVLGTREMLSGTHLSNYKLMGSQSNLSLVASTFGNPNAYGVFLAMGLPCLLILASAARSRKSLGASLFLIAWLFVLVLASGSRLSVTACLVTLAIWATFAGRKVSIVKVLLTSVFVLCARPFVSTILAPYLSGKILDFSLADVTFSQNAGLDSGSVRVNLTKNAIVGIRETGGFGVGPGNFLAWLTEHGADYPVGRNYSPHNAAAELGVQHGVLVLVAVITLIVFCFSTALRCCRSPDTGARNAAWLVICLVVTFPLYSLANSTFWDSPATWMAIAIFFFAALICREHLSVGVKFSQK